MFMALVIPKVIYFVFIALNDSLSLIFSFISASVGTLRWNLVRPPSQLTALFLLRNVPKNWLMKIPLVRSYVMCCYYRIRCCAACDAVLSVCNRHHIASPGTKSTDQKTGIIFWMNHYILCQKLKLWLVRIVGVCPILGSTFNGEYENIQSIHDMVMRVSSLSINVTTTSQEAAQ